HEGDPVAEEPRADVHDRREDTRDEHAVHPPERTDPDEAGEEAAEEERGLEVVEELDHGWWEGPLRTACRPDPVPWGDDRREDFPGMSSVGVSAARASGEPETDHANPG
ncbi:MAG: hypothetical protein ACK559_21560, partial [bacterium]